MSNGDLPETQPTANTETVQESEIQRSGQSVPAPSENEFTVGSSTVADAPPASVPIALGIAASAWLVPGLGHLLLGRWVRSLLFALCVFSLFLLGLQMEGRLYGWNFDRSSTAQSDLLQALEFFGDAGVGLPYFAAMRMELGKGNLENRSFDYGEKFLWVAGLLNYLIMLDAFDVAMRRKP